jgi:hypothetical protein
MTAKSWKQVKQEDVVIARQWHSKCVPVATDSDTVIEDALFSVWPMPRLYSEDQQQPVSSLVASEQWQFEAGHEESPLLAATS